MDFLDKMTQVIDYIEDHLADDIDSSEVAAIACCSTYQFGRMFSYIAGFSLSEYIRRRRLTKAAVELQNGKTRVIDAAMKFGYDSPDAFARAFKALYGITPREALKQGAKLKLYPRITFHLSISGHKNIEYRIEKKECIKCVGSVKKFGKWKVIDNTDTWQEGMGDVWLFWKQFLEDGMHTLIGEKYKLYRPPYYQLGVTQMLDNGEVAVMIGAEAKDDEEYPLLASFEIPAFTWAVFTVQGALDQKIHPLNHVFKRVIAEWLPSTNYELSSQLFIEVYGPGDTKSNDYICEYWMPVRQKE